MNQNRALITGVTGQDGSYLAEFLLNKGYEVAGLIRRVSTPNLGNIAPIQDKITFLEGDLLDVVSLEHAVRRFMPTEVYNLGAQTFVGASWDQAELTAEVTGLGALRILDALRSSGYGDTKFYQAGSSEQFGKVKEVPQNEETPFYPRSPYGSAKVFAHNTAVNYRESYGMFICNGILFNHESERRGIEFVTRKITDAVARIYAGKQHELKLGSLHPQRDWGYAPEYVEAMYLMMQQDEPDDYVIATGKTHSIEDFVECAFAHAGLDWKDYYVEDSRFVRPAEVNLLLGDPSKAFSKLGWRPKVDFYELVNRMVEHDLTLHSPRLIPINKERGLKEIDYDERQLSMDEMMGRIGS